MNSIAVSVEHLALTAAALALILLMAWISRGRRLERARLQLSALEAEKKRVEDLAAESRKQMTALSAANLEARGGLKVAESLVLELKAKYGGLISQEGEIANLRRTSDEITEEIEKLRVSYAEKRQHFDRLEHEIAIYDERLAFAELGVYEPHFQFDDSETFKRMIEAVRAQQKSMISAKTAAVCNKEWTVEGSKAQGQVMINRQTRLTLRAFNNECEAAISNVRWNNIVAMEKRILSAVSAIDKENASLELALNYRYVSSKIEELRLTHEYKERQKREKEDRAELARAEREEKRLLAEAEAAEREERKYQLLLEQARNEVAASGESELMRKRVAELEVALARAHAESERARAMAEMTRCGYVYIISNVGSFGEEVVKIGLTRRLDPDDRVRELGDASVPFAFDTHAMIYSDEAPTLESALHREFADRRINTSNMRKEFFRVALDEVEAAVSKLAPAATFFKDREAQEWHETLARRRQTLLDMQSKASRELPTAI